MGNIMDNLPFANSAICFETTAERPKTHARTRNQLKPEEWKELGPKIQRLYNEEGKTFEQVAAILHKENNFLPT